MIRNLKVKIPRLGRNRLGVFFVRFPSVVDKQGQRKVVQRSLCTKDPATAKLLALKFCINVATMDDALTESDNNQPPPVRWTANTSTGEFSADGEDDHARLMAFMSTHQDLLVDLAKLRAQATPQSAGTASLQAAMGARSQPTKPADTPLSEAFKLHLDAEAASLKSTHTVHEKRVLFDDFMQAFGPKVGINEITAHLITTRWTPIELSRENKKFGGTLSLARLEKRRGYLSKFFAWASDGGLYRADNPMKAKLAKKGQIRAKTTSYAEFTSDELAKIFGAGYPVEMNKPDWYWIPLIGLFTGARLSELCDLTLSDFYETEGVKLFEISDGKTVDSKRIVPIHSELIRFGLWDYVQHLRDLQATHFLPHRPPTTREKSVGREFGVWLDKCGITDTRKVFHSFRSTAITDMHNSTAGAAAIRKAVGHSSAAISGVHGDYVRGVQLKGLQAAIETLTFAGIDFASLKLPDPCFKAFFAAEAAARQDPKYLAQAQRRANHEASKAKRLAASRRHDLP